MSDSSDSSSDNELAIAKTPLLSSANSSSSDAPTVHLSAEELKNVEETLKERSATYSPFVAYCVTVNYILGVGVIGMPKAFAVGGWFLSTVVLFGVSIMASFTAVWYVEIGHRSERRLDHEDDELQERIAASAISLPSVELQSLPSAGTSSAASSSLTSHQSVPSDVLSSSISSTAPPPAPLSVLRQKRRRLEVNELIAMYISQSVRQLYEVLLTVYMCLTMWSYTSVFATAVCANIAIPFLNNGNTCVISDTVRTSDCYPLYLFWVFAFTCFVVPVASRNLTEMKWFVIALAALRFVAIAAMVIATGQNLYETPAVDDTGVKQSTATSAPYWSTAPSADWDGLALIIPVCIFAQIFHHSVPGIAYPLDDKRKAPIVFTSCLFTMFALYSLLGVTLALYYGLSIKSQATLMFVNYPSWFWSNLIVLFPAADVLSAFPLKAITVGNNIVHSFLPPQQAVLRSRQLPYRLFAVITPIIGACFVNNLSQLLTYTGSLGIVVAFLFPTVLQYLSIKSVGNAPSGVLSPTWHKIVNSQTAIFVVGGLSVIALFVVLINLANGVGGK